MKFLVFSVIASLVTAAKMIPEETPNVNEKHGLCPGEYYKIHPEQIPWFEDDIKSPPIRKPGGPLPPCKASGKGQGSGQHCATPPPGKRQNTPPSGFPNQNNFVNPSGDDDRSKQVHRKLKHPPLPPLSTATGCSQDWDCEKDLKCCWTFCGMKCLIPLFEEQTNEKEDGGEKDAKRGEEMNAEQKQEGNWRGVLGGKPEVEGKMK